MKLVLNEIEWAEEMLQQKSLGDRPFDTLTSLAKSYMKKGYDNELTRRKLEEFILMCDRSASLPKWSDSLQIALKRASKYPAVELDYLVITRAEKAIVDSLRGIQAKRLAFTLLCLAKYYDLSRGEENNHWVSAKDSEIMRMANISTSTVRQSALFSELREQGLIQFSKMVDNTNVRVTFIDDSSEESARVFDLRNLGYQYMSLDRPGFFVCQSCGLTDKIKNPNKGRPQKYCEHCAIEIRTRQNVNSVMRLRTS